MRQGRRRRLRGPRPVWRPEVPEGPVVVAPGLTVQHGELVILYGDPARASAMLRVLGGLDRTTPGTVRVLGSVAIVFTEPRLLPWRTVQDNVALALLGTRLHPVRREKARRMLEDVGLGEQRRGWPGTLTQEEAARAAVARALVGRPRLLLVDDPFGPLGPGARRRLARLLHDLWDHERPALLVATSDPAVARVLGGRVVPLDPDHTVDTTGAA